MQSAKAIKNNRHLVLPRYSKRTTFWTTEESWFHCWKVQEIFLFYRTSGSDLELSRFPILKAEGMLSPRAKRSEHEAVILPKLVAIPLPPSPHATSLHLICRVQCHGFLVVCDVILLNRVTRTDRLANSRGNKKMGNLMLIFRQGSRVKHASEKLR